jgi:hypothetical protein
MRDEEIRLRMNRNPYVCDEAEAYVTAINILAVEHLVKTDNYAEYCRLTNILSKADMLDLSVLRICLSLNHHTSSLGAMITQGDYEYQKECVMDFLEEIENGSN